MDPGFAPTGKRVRLTGACLYELRDGLISRHTVVYDGTSAMQQLGLLPVEGSLAFRTQLVAQNLGHRVRGLIKR